MFNYLDDYSMFHYFIVFIRVYLLYSHWKRSAICTLLGSKCVLSVVDIWSKVLVLGASGAIRSHSRSYVDAPMDVSRIATFLSSLTEFAAKYRSTRCKYVFIESDAGQNSLSVPNVAMTRGQLSFILVANCNDLAIRMVGITS